MELSNIKAILKEHEQCQGRYFLPLENSFDNLKVKVIDETYKAVRLKIKKGDIKKKVWLPKSQINFIVIGNIFVISLRTWLAKKTVKDYAFSLNK